MEVYRAANRDFSECCDNCDDYGFTELVCIVDRHECTTLLCDECANNLLRGVVRAIRAPDTARVLN